MRVWRDIYQNTSIILTKNAFADLERLNIAVGSAVGKLTRSIEDPSIEVKKKNDKAFSSDDLSFIGAETVGRRDGDKIFLVIAIRRKKL